MKQRQLGNQGLVVSEIGLGCMGMSIAYGSGDEEESIRVIHRAIDLGITLFDTAEIYGPYTNEELLGRAIKGKRDRIVIATKFGFIVENGRIIDTNSTPENVRRVCDASLQRLGVDYIDLFYQHRVDQKVPIEDTVGAMAELVQQGKVRYLGLSEAGPETLHRAHQVHPISALQTEYSLWERSPDERILPTLRELKIGFVPYSPIGRGFLTGQIKHFEDLAEDDYRRTDPRFQGDNFQKNLQIVEEVKQIAQSKGATPSQIALAWLLHQGDDIVPIPGTKRLAYLEENAAASDIVLSQDDLKKLDNLAQVTSGERYGRALMANVES
ncbi:aldo/keto reductase [Tolypothrix sp. FACHB-123]|uniref:aldo/keto reductase n=1 Tax=Tolypothrix sp. FACHB-123 TaxID=2692868 RepID=UPI0016827AF8|nr:aldo/keto reductase [Tolypothrix sp. FACHB-123]MBD2354182.1 aldo/keto reductase [Tolypothrix sp. FACHB-123]